MRFLRAITVVSLLVAPLVACTDRTSPHPTLMIIVDSTRYASHGDDGAWVWVSIRNVSSNPVQLAGCGGFHVFPQLEREQDAVWTSADTPVCSRLYAPLEIAPGAGIGMGALPSTVGTYRIRAPLYGDGAHVIRSAESSRVFEIY